MAILFFWYLVLVHHIAQLQHYITESMSSETFGNLCVYASVSLVVNRLHLDALLLPFLTIECSFFIFLYQRSYKK